LATGGTTAVTVDSSQNVGLGTSSPISTAKTSIKQASGGGTGSTQLHLEQSNATDGYGLKCDSADGALAFSRYASGSYTERARFNANGTLGIGSTSNNSGLTVANVGNNGWVINTIVPVSTQYTHMVFSSPAGNPGSITTNGSTTAFNTSSDYRLKENIAPMTGALSVVQQLNPVTYKWKLDGSDGQGFIAHELQEVVPDCVTGEKDGINEDGSPKYQGVDVSFLVATLTAAIQEQQAIIEQLRADVEALKAAA
jgi:hypothetical protein